MWRGCCGIEQGSVGRWAACILLWVYIAAHLAAFNSGTMPAHISMMPDHHAVVRRGYSCRGHGTVWRWAASVLLWVYTCSKTWPGDEFKLVHCILMADQHAVSRRGCRCRDQGTVWRWAASVLLLVYTAGTLGLQMYSGTMPVHISMMLDHLAVVRKGCCCRDHGTVWRWAASVLLSGFTLQHTCLHFHSGTMPVHISMMLDHQALVRKGCCCMDHGTVWRWAACVLLWIHTAAHFASSWIQAPCLCTAAWFLLYSVERLLLHRPGQCVVMGCICPAVGLHCSTLDLQFNSGTMPVHISMMPDHRCCGEEGLQAQGPGHCVKVGCICHAVGLHCSTLTCNSIQAPCLCTSA